MLLINPMWDSENERIGCRRCSPMAYVLHAVSDYFSLAAVLYLTVRLIGVAPGSAWYALLLWLCGRLLSLLHYRLLAKRGFVYDYASDTARWHDRQGVPQQYPDPDRPDPMS